MFGLFKVFCMVITVVSLGADDLVLRAKEIRYPVSVTHVDSIELYVSSSLSPYLKLRGRHCLVVETQTEFCDFVEHDFDLPSEVKVRSSLPAAPKAGASLRVFLWSATQMHREIGSLSPHQHIDEPVELQENISLFYDRYHKVPGLVFSELPEAQRIQLSRKEKFKKLYKVEEEY